MYKIKTKIIFIVKCIVSAIVGLSLGSSIIGVINGLKVVFYGNVSGGMGAITGAFIIGYINYKVAIYLTNKNETKLHIIFKLLISIEVAAFVLMLFVFLWYITK